ncbi:MAG: hypothetical protein LBC74_13055 [Planctomycetaceae bacterium]|jgi:hypothetical protein|nr:hypothetical protein [Planctomycetaceae bacterium]
MEKITLKKISYVIVLLFVVLLLSGCLSGSSYQTTDLDGVVTIDGVPVNDGMLSFAPTSGAGGRGVRTNIVAGKYTAKKVPVGEVDVTFTAVKKTGKKFQAMGVEVDEQISIVPEKYKEGIKIEIITGQKKHDFILTSTPISITTPEK